MAEDLPTLSEIFLNASVPALPLAGAFGVCYVAFAGAHDIRYRGEKLLEVAARQVTAAAAARGSTIAQCVATDQPERKRPYVQLSVPLRTSLDVTPFAAKCEEYTRRFKRPCKLLFGYMAKAIAVARPPYSTTLFVDTDTFVCDATPLLAFPRLMKSFDVLLLLPRTTQGWTNSGVLGVRREASRGWAMAWQREFLSLDDFGDQLHLLKVLPARASDRRRLAAKRRGGGGGGLEVGELSPELHFRYGAVADAAAQLKLPVLRGPPMLLHSKGLAALTKFAPFFAQRFRAEQPTATLRQLVGLLGDGQPEAKKRGEHAAYSAQALGGFCALLTDGWDTPAGGRLAQARQFVLNSEGNCTACSLPPTQDGSVGAIISDDSSGFLCNPTEGTCGVRTAAWPDGTERGLPDWYKAFLQKRGSR